MVRSSPSYEVGEASSWALLCVPGWAAFFSSPQWERWEDLSPRWYQVWFDPAHGTTGFPQRLARFHRHLELDSLASALEKVRFSPCKWHLVDSSRAEWYHGALGGIQNGQGHVVQMPS